MKPCQTLQKESTQERERKKEGARTKVQASQTAQKSQATQGGKGTAKSISNCAQCVTPDGKIYCEKVEMCRFSLGNWLLCTKFVQLAVACRWRNTVLHLQKECNKLDLTAVQYF